MQYCFDEYRERRGTGSVKFDLAQRRGKGADLLPLWVADMDFPIPVEAREALKERSEHGIFGYTEPLEDYYEAVLGWIGRHQGWQPREEWLVITPGVVFALAAALQAYTNPGDAVLIQPPVYYPFRDVIRDNDRVVVNAPLSESDGRYSVDFDAFEETVRSRRPKAFFLCNPHNPVGRVWSREELQRMGAVCARYGVTVISDEIHADFARPGFEHVSFVSACPELADSCVVCTAPSKTFNIAGLQISNIFVPDASMRARFRQAVRKTGYDNANAMGVVATQACCACGDAWLAQLKGYLEENLSFVRSYLKEHIPVCRLVEPESTYLAWIDCRGLGLSHADLISLVEKDARLWLDHGAMFGKEGEGFMRVNLATQKSTLQEALGRLQRAVEALER